MGRNKTLNKLRKAGVHYEITANGQNIVTTLINEEQSANVRGIVDGAGVASYTHYRDPLSMNPNRPYRCDKDAVTGELFVDSVRAGERNAKHFRGGGLGLPRPLFAGRGSVATVNSERIREQTEMFREKIEQEVRFRQAFNKCVEEIKTDERVRVWMEEMMKLD